MTSSGRYEHRGIAIASPSSVSNRLLSESWATRLGYEDAIHSAAGSFEIVTWGEPLIGGLRRRPPASQEVYDSDLGVIFSGDHGVGRAASELAIAQMCPPWAVVEFNSDSLAIQVDELGFEHLYWREHADGTALSTSARAIALLSEPRLSMEAVAVQSLLGWQLGVRSMFEDVAKLPPRATLHLAAGKCRNSLAQPARESAEPPATIEVAARAAAQMLRRLVGAVLDEHPDAELQLTGGLDSRILLAAVPPERRRGLSVMTLEVEGSEDAAIASGLANRFGMQHRRINLSGLSSLSPGDAYELCMTSARRVDSAADPIGLAAVDFAEMHLDSRPRISGLGGEVARGFYYLGSPRVLPVTRARVERLAHWRLFPNEAAPKSMLDPEFSDWASRFVVDDLLRLFLETERDWFAATDEFYLGQRMQRWAGVLASATALERVVVNPMLNPEFLTMINLVPPHMKQNARLLGAILLELDEELARIPLDGRPAPMVYARPGVRSRMRLGTVMGKKVLKKVRQRLTGGTRPPEGGVVLSGLVLRHLQANPDLLNPLMGLDVFDRGFLDRMLYQNEDPGPSGVALILGLLATQR